MKSTFYKILLLPLLLSSSYSFSLFGQHIGAVKTTWDGEWNHWTIYEDDIWEDEVGHLELRWNDRWDVWDYRVGEETGSIKMKWKNNPNNWEIKANNQIITFETVWKGDFDTWRIRTSDGIIKVSVRDREYLEEWETGKDWEEGYWGMWTEYEHELGAWLIADEISESIDLEVKMILLFIPIISHFRKG